jgi:hypothetical protein
MENMYSAWEAGLSAEKKYSKDNIFHKNREISILMMKKK